MDSCPFWNTRSIQPHAPCLIYPMTFPKLGWNDDISNYIHQVPLPLASCWSFRSFFGWKDRLKNFDFLLTLRTIFPPRFKHPFCHPINLKHSREFSVYQFTYSVLNPIDRFTCHCIYHFSLFPDELCVLWHFWSNISLLTITCSFIGR